MKPYLFKIGKFELRVYSLMYIISLFLSIFIVKRDNILRKRLTLSDKEIEDYAFLVMICGLIGARIYYVIFRFDIYKDNLLSMLYVWQGGLAIHGGIIGGVIGIYLYSKYKKQDFFALTDITVVPLLLSQGLGRIGNFFNGEIHGVPVFTPLKVIFQGNFKQWWEMYQKLPYDMQASYKNVVPWGIVFPDNTPAGMEFPSYLLHPAMIYELILNILGFLFLYFFMRKKNFKKGVISFTYLILYAVIRSFVSMFRAEDLMFYSIRAPHLISIIMVIIAILGLGYIHLYEKK